MMMMHTRRFLAKRALRLRPAAAAAWRRPTAAATSTSGLRRYHERVIEHYENPKNVGSLPKDETDVGVGLVGAPACGDVLKLSIRVKDGVVEDARFKTFGCGSAIASSSLATEWIKGKTLEESSSIKNTDIAKHLSLPPVKLHCSMLAEDAIKAAIADYKKKHDAQDSSPSSCASQCGLPGHLVVVTVLLLGLALLFIV